MTGLEGIYAFYALLAIVIPFIVQEMKKLSFIPQRFVAWIPLVLGFVSVFFTELSMGAPFMTAALMALGIGGVGIGGAATQGRNIVVKSLKKPKA